MHSRKNETKKIVLVVALLLSISGLHFFISVYKGPYHDIFDRLYYIPIIFSAFFFGLRGGTAVAISSGILFFMHLVIQWNMQADDHLFSKYLEIVMYLVVGIITGILSDLGRKRQTQTEEAYYMLNQSFEKAKEAARLAAIGRVSAGVAHEIRNPLGGIKGAVEIVSKEFDPSHPKWHFVKIIEKEIARLNNIVEDFLNFAKPRKPELSPADINVLLNSVLDLNKKNMNKKNITLTCNLDKNMSKIYIDPNKIKQVFLNIILNAIDSMIEGGSLEIVSKVCRETVEVLISDTGTGIDKKKYDRLFEPFFTTKKYGTGMGLAISKQIIEQHNGQISIDNRKKTCGSSAKVVLPISTAS